MRRTTTLTALAALLAVAPLGLAAAPAQAAETCDGKVATIVVAARAGLVHHRPGRRDAGRRRHRRDGAERRHRRRGRQRHDLRARRRRRPSMGGDGRRPAVRWGWTRSTLSDDDYFGDLLAPGAGRRPRRPRPRPAVGGHLVLELDIEVWDQVSYADAAGRRTRRPRGRHRDRRGHRHHRSDRRRSAGRSSVIGPPRRHADRAARPRLDRRRRRATTPSTAGEGDDLIDAGRPEPTTSGWPTAARPVQDRAGDDVVSTAVAGDDGVVGAARRGRLPAAAGDDRLRSDRPSRGTRVLGGPGRRPPRGMPATSIAEGQGGQRHAAAARGRSGRRHGDGLGGAGRDEAAPRRRSRRLPKRHARGASTCRTRGVVAIDGEQVVTLRLGASIRPELDARPGADHLVRHRSRPTTWFDLENSNRSVRASGGGGNDTDHRAAGSADLLDGGPGRDVLDGSRRSRPLPAR